MDLLTLIPFIIAITWGISLILLVKKKAFKLWLIHFGVALLIVAIIYAYYYFFGNNEAGRQMYDTAKAIILAVFLWPTWGVSLMVYSFSRKPEEEVLLDDVVNLNTNY